MAPALPLRKPDDWYELSLRRHGREGRRRRLRRRRTGTKASCRGTSTCRYELWEATDILRGSVFTDRGVYKPGEDVHVKAIVRADTPTGIRLLPAGTTLDVRVPRQPRTRGRRAHGDASTRWSSAEWTWTVPADGTLGNYRSTRALPGRPTAAEQRRHRAAPREREGDWLKQVDGIVSRRGLSAAGLPRRRDADRGRRRSPARRCTARSTARYLFGSAMAQAAGALVADATAGPSRCPRPFIETFPDERYAFGYYPDGERRRGARVAGADAHARRRRAARRRAADATRDVDFAYRYTFEGDVEDVSRQHIAEPRRASSCIRRRGTSACAARLLRRHRRPARAWTSSPSISRRAPSPDVPVTLTLTRVQWNSVRRAEGGGFYTWDTEEVEMPAGEWTVTSAADAGDRSRFPCPKAATTCSRATAKDADRPHDADRDVVLRPRQGLHRVGALRPQPHHARAGEEDLEAGRDGARHDSVAVGIGDGAADRRARRHPQLRALRADVHAADRRGADHRSRHPERVRLGAADSRPHVERSGRGRQRSRQAGVPPRLRRTERRRRDEAADGERHRRSRRSTGPANTAKVSVARHGRRRAGRRQAKSRSGPWTTACCRSPAITRRTCSRSVYRRQGAAGHERRQPAAHHQPARADAEGRRRRRRRRRRGGRGDVPARFPAARVLARARSRPTRPASDARRHAARVADDVPHHGGRRRHGVALRIGGRRDQGQQAGHAARRVSALPDARRSRVVRRAS